jgi:hypothetical protein
MLKKITKKLFPFLALTLLVTACKKDKDDPNEEELITTVILTFSPVGGGAPATFTFRDLDGPGGTAPTVFQDIVLSPAKVYNVSATFTNESVSPAEDITSEIVAEGGDHQIYYTPTGANVTVSNLNNDSGGLPLGTTSTWTTTTASNGSMLMTLKHKPGVKAAADPVTKGDTDVEINWVVRVL